VIERALGFEIDPVLAASAILTFSPLQFAARQYVGSVHGFARWAIHRRAFMEAPAKRAANVGSCRHLDSLSLLIEVVAIQRSRTTPMTGAQKDLAESDGSLAAKRYRMLRIAAIQKRCVKRNSTIRGERTLTKTGP
jgi:hypothetical protein